jgi:CRP-like cAMP-binding protein
LSVNTPRNRILASLSPEDFDRIGPHLEKVHLELKQVLFDVDQPIEYAYFPESCVASLLGVMADGTAVETATAGPEGMIGLPLFHGTDRTSAQAVCQIAGDAYRLRAERFREDATRPGSLHTILHKYSQALFTLIAQSSACNRRHTMRERCIRWLLHTHDRVGRPDGYNEIALTHQFLSQMLGVRRASVTEALGALQREGLISYSMGRITILNRAGLERESCECYFIITREFDRLLGTGPEPVLGYANPLRDVKTMRDGYSALGDGGHQPGTEP